MWRTGRTLCVTRHAQRVASVHSGRSGAYSGKLLGRSLHYPRATIPGHCKPFDVAGAFRHANKGPTIQQLATRSAGILTPSKIALSCALGAALWFSPFPTCRLLLAEASLTHSNSQAEHVAADAPKAFQPPAIEEFDKDPDSDTSEALATSTVWSCVLGSIQEALALGLSLVAICGLAWVGVALPKAVAELIDLSRSNTSGHGAESAAKSAALAVLRMGILFTVESGLTLTSWALLSWTCECFALRVRAAVYGKFLRLDISHFDMHRVGSMVHALEADVKLVRQAAKHFLGSGLRHTMALVGGVVALFVISPKLTCFMLVLVPGMVGAGSVFAHYLRVLQRKIHAHAGEALSEATEGLANVRTVRAFANEDYQTGKFVEKSESLSALERRYQFAISSFHALHKLAVSALVLVVLWYGGTLVTQGELTSGELGAFMMHSTKLQASLARLSELVSKVHKGWSAGNRLDNILASPVAIPVTGGTEMVLGAGEVNFKNVTFSYPARPHVRVLDGINFTLTGGKVTALVGESGSGKSTVAALLERFYDPQEGSINLDDQDVRTLDPSWLRRCCIGLVDQEPVLFGGSIAENIRYGRLGASEEDIEAAARAANCHDFIAALPQGYNTQVGERGVALSGGQKQRVAIARGLLKDPTILILDEATSALDSESERLVQDALARLMKGRTTLIIAHRLSTVQDADQILVMRQGKIVERGTHTQLMQQKGVYANLVAAQLY